MKDFPQEPKYRNFVRISTYYSDRDCKNLDFVEKLEYKSEDCWPNIKYDGAERHYCKYKSLVFRIYDDFDCIEDELIEV